MPMYCTIAIALRSDTTVCAYLCYSLLGLACARNENMQLVIHYMLKNKHTSKSTGDSFDQPQFQHALLSSWIFVSGSQNGCALSFAGSFCLYIGFPWISHIFLFDIMRLEHFGLLSCCVLFPSCHITSHLHTISTSCSPLISKCPKVPAAHWNSYGVMPEHCGGYPLAEASGLAQVSLCFTWQIVWHDSHLAASILPYGPDQ